MNKRQAKKRWKKKKKQLDNGLFIMMDCAKRIGEFLGKWVGDGMSFQCKKEAEHEDYI